MEKPTRKEPKKKKRLLYIRRETPLDKIHKNSITMKRLTIDPSKYTQSKSKATSSWTALAEEIRDRFQVPMKRFIWLFWRVPEDKIRQAFKESSTIDQLIKYSQQLNKH